MLMGFLLFVACAAITNAEPPPLHGDTPADRFVEGIRSDSAVPPEARDLLSTAWADCQGCDAEEFLTQALAVLSPRFREGLDAYDADDYERCAEVMRGLSTDADPFVAVNAAAYEIKALIAREQILEAQGLVETLLADGGLRLARYSYFLSEMRFLQGFCLLADLQYAAARDALDSFLATHPDAAQRLVVMAQQMLAELANRVPERIGEVVDLMHYSRRRLNVGDTADKTRERQERIVALLDRLIEEAEEMEKSGAGTSGGSGRSRPDKTPRSPMPDSRLPGGRSVEGTEREARRANPGEMWGAMPPAQREQVLQALRESFPSRYRRLVEQYYEDLAKKR